MTSCTASFDGRDRLLEVEGLQTFFDSDEGTTCAVDRVSFRVSLGETFGLVGESGSGKTVTALSILGLNASPPGFQSVRSGAMVCTLHYPLDRSCAVANGQGGRPNYPIMCSGKQP
ncbi:MAG: ATP-binding cassette domain-containing protein, partial [Alphaproteobacteria bacterium]|nr:ATP-binding cassette domain-containing protein [Alphaproteobacteria bacterium]